MRRRRLYQIDAYGGPPVMAFFLRLFGKVR